VTEQRSGLIDQCRDDRDAVEPIADPTHAAERTVGGAALRPSVSMGTPKREHSSASHAPR